MYWDMLQGIARNIADLTRIYMALLDSFHRWFYARNGYLVRSDRSSSVHPQSERESDREQKQPKPQQPKNAVTPEEQKKTLSDALA